jgi:hypothetical protein
MRTQLWAVVAIGLWLGAGTARADEQADTKALLGKAMKAMSGEAKLAKLSTATVKGKVTGVEGGQDFTLAFDGIWQDKNQYRVEVEVQRGGQTFTGVLVINGDKGWLKTMDKTDEAPEGVAPFIQNLFTALRMPQLLPALTDKAYTLSLLGEVKVGDKAAVGLSISHQERKNISLFFDKDTGLPLKSEIRVTEPKGSKEVTVEYHYSDYKDFDGVKLCGKITIKADDKEFTLELKEIKPAEKVDGSQFDKP